MTGKRAPTFRASSPPMAGLLYVSQDNGVKMTGGSPMGGQFSDGKVTRDTLRGRWSKGLVFSSKRSSCHGTLGHRLGSTQSRIGGQKVFQLHSHVEENCWYDPWFPSTDGGRGPETTCRTLVGSQVGDRKVL